MTCEPAFPARRAMAPRRRRRRRRSSTRAWRPVLLARAERSYSRLAAEEAARIAEYDVQAAAAFVEANLDLASATDAASREAAEAALEAAVESISVQGAVEATMQDLNIAEDLA